MGNHIALKKFCAPLAAAVLLLASAPTWARGPAVSVEFEGLGLIDAISVTVEGPRGKTCDASKTRISIVRSLDANSAALFQAAVSGTPFLTVTIYIAGAQFWLDDAVVTSYSISGGGEGPPSETVILSAASMSPHQPPDCD